MKYILFFILLILCAKDLTGQILNGNFSEWESNGVFETPKYWNINSGNTAKVFKMESVDKTWIKFMIPDQENFNCHATISQSISKSEIQNVNDLVFDLKSRSLNSDSTTFFRVILFHFNNTDEFEIIEYQSIEFTNIINDFTQFTIPVDNIPSDSLLINLTGGGGQFPSDGCFGESIIELSGISFNTATSNTNTKLKKRNIFPNPSSDYLFLEGHPQDFISLQIINNIGQSFDCKIADNMIDVRNLTQGVYHIFIDGHSFSSFIKL